MNQIPATGFKPARFYRPPGFDPTRFGFAPEEAFAVLYFLHIIRWKRIQWEADEQGYSRLKWEYLERVVGRDRIFKLRLRLLQREVIEWDPTIVRGAKCQGFRIRSPYREQRWELVTCTDERLNRRIRALRADGAVAPLAVHDWLTARFDDLAFDLDRAREIVGPLQPDREFLECGRTVEEYREILADQCQALADGMGETTVCRFGRFHSPVTRLHRALRPCLSVDGRPLVELDVANSQPLFLGLVAREYFRSRMAQKRLLARTFGPTGGVYRYGRRAPATGPAPVAGVERYIEVCEQGWFYESLMRPGDDRDEFKRDLFHQVFFGANTARKPRPLRDRFRSMYPEVFEVLTALKRTDYKRSAWVLQNAEATLVIGAICGRLMRERPGLTVFTVHDSFLVAAEDVAFVRAVVQDEFGRRGVKVRVRVKP